MSESSQAALGLTWVTQVPIVEIRPDEVESRARALRDAMAGWDRVAVPQNPGQDDIDPRDWQSPKRSFQARWNARLSATNDMLLTMTIMTPSDDAYCVEYRAAGVPVGLMVMDLDGPVAKIEELLTHPGSVEGGGVLMEHAVAVAQQRCGSPCIRLYPLDGDAREAYRHLGFADAKDGWMILDPAKAQGVWENSTGPWRLARYAKSTTYLG